MFVIFLPRLAIAAYLRVVFPGDVQWLRLEFGFHGQWGGLSSFPLSRHPYCHFGLFLSSPFSLLFPTGHHVPILGHFLSRTLHRLRLVPFLPSRATRPLTPILSFATLRIHCCLTLGRCTVLWRCERTSSCRRYRPGTGRSSTGIYCIFPVCFVSSGAMQHKCPVRCISPLAGGHCISLALLSLGRLV